jgi:hypothetical protein
VTSGRTRPSAPEGMIFDTPGSDPSAESHPASTGMFGIDRLSSSASPFEAGRISDPNANPIQRGTEYRRGSRTRGTWVSSTGCADGWLGLGGCEGLATGQVGDPGMDITRKEIPLLDTPKPVYNSLWSLGARTLPDVDDLLPSIGDSTDPRFPWVRSRSEPIPSIATCCGLLLDGSGSNRDGPW